MRIPRWLLSLLAPLGAILLAIVISTIVLQVSGNPPGLALSSMWRYGTRFDSFISIVNRATPLYLSAVAVAIGFQMNLFNIGVEGNYRISALLAASFGAAVSLPAPLHVLSIIVVAMLVGASWSGLAAVLKVKRGVHEVITSIMMNAIATAVGAWLLLNHLQDKNRPSSDLVTKTKTIDKSGWFPPLDRVVGWFGKEVPKGQDLHGFLVVAILVGIGYWVLVWRTRFGFDLRASGINPTAARASGVVPAQMIVRTMLLSGAVAGLVGMPQLMSFSHNYSIDFVTGLGFNGIGIALLGRNHPVGIGLGAFIWAFLDRSAQILDLNDIPKEIAVIMQGVTVLSVVVAYEVAKRFIQTAEVKAAAGASAASAPRGMPPSAPAGALAGAAREAP